MSLAAAGALLLAAVLAVVLDARRAVAPEGRPAVGRLLLASLVLSTAAGLVLTALRLRSGG